MAKRKKSVNQSEAIRGVLREAPLASVKEIVAQLKAQGIDVRETLVYGVKKGMVESTPSVSSPITKAIPTPPTSHIAPDSGHHANGAVGVGVSIKVARAAADKVGGWAALKEIVDAMQ